MLKIIPSVKILKTEDRFLEKNGIFFDKFSCDSRIASVLSKLPYDESGAKLEVCVDGGTGEDYELTISENLIRIKASGNAGAFYAAQTLRQIFKHEKIPCLYIKDKPDFSYRGFYHDVTRGKIPTVATVKALIDKMAYYKLNSLQLYIEHTFECEEYSDVNAKEGYFTSEELKEIDKYCKENFIEFIPSLSTFGHLYELLEQDKYKHLRIVKENDDLPNFWRARMRHHTIDPLNPESEKLICGLIDKYAECFTSDTFNICCDETFDLKSYGDQGYDTGKLYVEFVKKLVDHLISKGKKVMMWGDILLNYPDVIVELPSDVCFLNWNYGAMPSEENIIKFASLGRKQIVCPGTSSWNRFCECVHIEESNICLMAEYGHKHGAVGVLNTNWGDWGNPCSLDLAMYGMVLGAEKSWSADTRIDDRFYSAVNLLLYGCENGVQYLKDLSNMQRQARWTMMCSNYFDLRFNSKKEFETALYCSSQEIQKLYIEFNEKLSSEKMDDEIKQEMLIAAEGLCVIAELSAKMTEEKVNRVTNTYAWLEKYGKKWLEKNKPSELYKIEEMFRFCETVL